MIEAVSITDSELLTVKEVAVALRVSVREVYRLRQWRILVQPLQVGGCNRWYRRDVVQALENLDNQRRNGGGHVRISTQN